MSGKSKRSVEETLRFGGARGSEQMPWSRSRRRAAAYAASVEYSMGLMSISSRVR